VEALDQLTGSGSEDSDDEDADLFLDGPADPDARDRVKTYNLINGVLHQVRGGPGSDPRWTAPRFPRMGRVGKRHRPSRGSGRANNESHAMNSRRSAVLEDALHVLRVAGILFSLPVLAWVLGVY
jgi:hypothetical protein